MSVLTFGKHSGEAIASVPTDYLSWLVTSCDRLTPWLRSEIESELANRPEKPKRNAGNGAAADKVLAAVQDAIEARVSDDDGIDHETAGKLTDHVMLACDEVRAQFKIGGAR